jgi:glycogen debranching enzyme
MKSYVQQTAEIFDGIRLDNCHSTPIPVACFMLDAARRVRPDLYVIAELFTTSEHADNVFVNHLGINSLIRESMSCHDSHELGRLVHRFGGKPVGSFAKTCFRPLTNSVSHAIFFDVTHDNESPVVKKTAYDLLPTSALLALSDNATGSTRGHDELVPHHIHVVKEDRFYASWNEDEEQRLLHDPTHINYSNGIIKAKKVLNDLHHRLSQEGFSEIFVDQVDSNVVAVTRHNPENQQTVVLAARTCFQPQDPLITGFIRNIEIAGTIREILLEGRMMGKMTDAFVRHPDVINGVPASDFRADIRLNVPPEKSSLVTVVAGDINQIRFDKFTPSSVIAFHVSLSEKHEIAMRQLKQHVDGISVSLKPVIQKIDLLSLHHILFKCQQEERDEIATGGTYSVPGFTDFVFAGLCGLMFHWKTIRTVEDLGHPICHNLRSGNWLPDYITDRLVRRDSTKELGEWMRQGFRLLPQLPQNLIPRSFDSIITPVYSHLISQLLSRHSEFVRNGSKFVQLLAVGAIALVGWNQTAPLPPLSPNLSAHSPAVHEADGVRFPVTATISAGLPHFSSGYMRNWGRDTFISLRGLLLVTGRYAEARNIILGFAAALRHGLIPNLLDTGIRARYNCRDAVWFWMQTVKEYCLMAPNGTAILSEPVCRLFIDDNDEARVRDATEQPLHQVIQEALLRHFRGIDFKERNWGVQIDAHMREAGFHVTAGVNRDTGFVYGGNKFNCGTWMDKMGSSSKAGNRGIPSSPRDGSAIELIGLQYSVIHWLHQINDSTIWPYEGVTDGTTFWSWSDWSSKILLNFERCFWVDACSQHPLINRRNIYKDTCGASDEWQDFQLRPNFVVAMAVAPELFDVSHARSALSVAQETLLGPLGMRTLDPGYVMHCVVS